MLVHQQESDSSYSGDCEPAEVEALHQRQQAAEHRKVQDSRYPQRVRDSERLRDTEQRLLTIKVKILTGVDDVETCGPEGDGRGKPQNSGIQRAADCDPGCGWCDSERKPEDYVRERGKAFRVRICHHDTQSDR